MDQHLIVQNFQELNDDDLLSELLLVDLITVSDNVLLLETESQVTIPNDVS